MKDHLCQSILIQTDSRFFTEKDLQSMFNVEVNRATNDADIKHMLMDESFTTISSTLTRVGFINKINSENITKHFT